MRVPETAITAFGDRHALTDLCEVSKQCLAVFFVDLSANRHLEDDVLAVRAGAVLPHPISAALRFEVLLITVIDEGIEAGNRFHHDITTSAAVAAVGAAEFDEFIAPERHAAVPTCAGRDVDLGFIEEFHGLNGITYRRDIRQKMPGIKFGEIRSSPRAANCKEIGHDRSRPQ